MNQELLQKLGKKIRHISCNSLKRVYASQIREWVGATDKDARIFIEYLLQERLIMGKYDFICSCGNQNTAFLKKLERTPYLCPICEREYSMQEVQEIGTLLFEIDKSSVLDYSDNETNIDKCVNERLKIVPLRVQKEKTVEIFIGSSSNTIEYMDTVACYLEDNNVKPLQWNAPDKGIFVPGTNTIDALFEITKRVDGAIFIFNADDITWNDKCTIGPEFSVRDNVLFEYGLFAGALGGKDKVCFICKGDPAPRIASDLNGITYIDGEKETHAKKKIKDWLDRLKNTVE